MTKLEVLTNELIRFEDISKRGASHTVYKLEKGTSISFDLYRSDEVDVFKSYLSKDTIFPLHRHELSDEIFILIKGQVTVICDEDGIENRHELKIGIPFTVKRSMNHLLSVGEESWLIIMVIPPDVSMLK